MDDEIPLQGDSHASSSHEASLESTFKRRVKTHFRSDRKTKITRVPCRRCNGGAVPRAEKFGDLITADHQVLGDNCESRNNHRYAIVVQDSATRWIHVYSCKNKTSQETQRSMRALEESESHLHWQFLGIRQSLWRSLLESLHVYTTQVGD